MKSMLELKAAFAATKKENNSGSWLQHKATLQELKTANIRCLIISEDDCILDVVGANVTGAITMEDVKESSVVTKGKGINFDGDYRLTEKSMANVENIIDDLLLIVGNFKEKEDACNSFTFEGDTYVPISLSASALRQGKRFAVKEKMLDKWLNKLKAVNHGIGSFDKTKTLKVGKATKLSTYGNLWSANGKEFVVDLNEYCFMIFDNMAIFGTEDNMDGQSYHSHYDFCELYGCPKDKPLYLQARVSGCTKTGSLPVKNMSGFWALAAECKQYSVMSLSEVDRDYSGEEPAVWIVGNPCGKLLYVTDFNGFKAVPGYIDPKENTFKVLQIIESTQAKVSSQLIQHI